METLETLKNNYAQEQGYEDWKTFLNYYGGRHPEWFDQHWKEICIRAQKVASEKKIERLKSLRSVYDAGSGQHNILSLLLNEFETTPENLIR